MNISKLVWSPEAEEDLRGIYYYIKIKLNEPKVAENIISRITANTEKLKLYYNIYPLVFLKKTRPVRKIKVKRYLIFYTFYEEENTVYILRIFHERRDWNKLLS